MVAAGKVSSTLDLIHRAGKPAVPTVDNGGVRAPRVTLDIRKILRILPQRPPLLMLDRVDDLQLRKSARGHRAVTYNEPFFDRLSHAAPVLPPTLCLEAMFQLTCVLVATSIGGDTGQQVISFAGLDRAKFRHPVGPGDLMRIDVEVHQHRGNIWKCSGRVHVGEALCAEAELLVATSDGQA